MKFFAVVCLFSLSICSGAFSQEVVEAPIDHIFVPKGFDNNDHVEILVTGKFPNPCYVRNAYEVKVSKELILVKVSSLSMNDPVYTKCEPLKIPFTEVINLGNLQGGSYKIIVNQGGVFQMQETIHIGTAASQSVDNNIYAKVDYVELGFTGGVSGDAILVAQSPSPCLVFDRVEYLLNNKDTISVLPIMKKISSNCPEQTVRFEIPITFKLLDLPSSSVLLFVRTLEGRSVHSFVIP